MSFSREPSVAPALPPSPAPRWSVEDPPDPDVVRRLQAELSLPRPLCAVLALRGHDDPESAKAFLRPRIEHLHDPELLPDAAAATERLARAIRSGETVFVHGDYDVDGVCATALFTRWIRHLGGTVVPFVPHRVRDGYDFGPGGLAAAKEAGASLILTADCGTSAHDAVAEAGAAGMDVIVTDHHQPPDSLPDAVAVVNPSRGDSAYPDAALCGAGVAFKVCELLRRAFDADRQELLGHLDLVALATVADLVPLRGENRVLVRHGLRVLARSSNPGLRALLSVSGLQGTEVSAGQVGFVLGPRINAVGRMADAGTGLRLLLTEDAGEAATLAGELDEENLRRREEDRRTLEEALELLAEGFDPDEDFGVVLAREGWHPGVIGIVASRVVDRIHRPTVLIALDGDQGRGSARSVKGFDLFEAVKGCAEHLGRFGGHKAAAGMDIARDAVPAFREAFNARAREGLSDDLLHPLVRAELELSLADLTPELFRYLPYAGPFGIGNPRPVFVTRGARLTSPPRVVGEGHLKLQLEQDGARLPAIGFRLARRIPPETLGQGDVDLAYQLQVNEYRGRKELQAKLLDVRPSS